MSPELEASDEERQRQSERTKEALSCQGTEFTKEDDQINFVRVF